MNTHHTQFNRKRYFWLLMLAMVVFTVVGFSAISLVFYQEHGLLENMQSAVLLGIALHFACLSRLPETPTNDRFLWRAWAMLFVILLLRETSMLRGVLYAENAIWWGISNRWYARGIMAILGVVAIYRLLRFRAWQWWRRKAFPYGALLACVVLVALNYAGEHGWFGWLARGVIVEENSELMIYLIMWSELLQYYQGNDLAA